MLTRRDFNSSLLTTAASTAVAPMTLAQQKPKRLIVDAQVHIWKANTSDRPWVQGTQAQLPEPMTAERL